MANGKIRLIWYPERFTQRLRNKLSERLEVATGILWLKAKQNAPVKTGALRDSIDYIVKPEELRSFVGSELKYAPFVEFGTRKMAPRGFLRNSLEYLKSRMIEILKGG